MGFCFLLPVKLDWVEGPLVQEAGVLGSFSESANTWVFDIGLENSLDLSFPSVKKGKIISCLCTS